MFVLLRCTHYKKIFKDYVYSPIGIFKYGLSFIRFPDSHEDSAGGGGKTVPYSRRRRIRRGVLK